MKHTIFLFLLFPFFQVSAQDSDSVINSLTYFRQALDRFSKYIPQEKVYLHFDNTSYYQGDPIWFRCYVVTSGLHRATELSKTLYVELLNPGGEVIDKRILKIENGRCHGEFTLNRIPFYSGFYEVRAYTKYMLNFGEDVIFSRLFPVFEKPKKEGNWEEKNMQKYGLGKYPRHRNKPQKEKKVNVKFYPEGGHLIQGVESRVAFEATDEFGNPIEITGHIVNREKENVVRFSTGHEGKGVFTYTPGDEEYKGRVVYNDKTYSFDLPGSLPQGFVMKVDNLSHPDSLGITVQKNRATPEGMLGLTVISGGKPFYFYIVGVVDDKEVHFVIDKTRLPAGVSQVVLFNPAGEIIGDRLIFIHPNDLLNIQLTTEPGTHQPYEPVDLEFMVTDNKREPVCTEFSLSVTDVSDQVVSGHTILTNLLLMSEIKGYVRNPSFYFESDLFTHRTALDLLLMVQGWRRYSWKQMAGLEPIEVKYLPEQGIETHGRVVSFVRKIPKPNVDVSSFLLQRGNEEKKGVSFMETFVTDSLGRFSFVSDVEGKWNMILSVTEKGKKKDHRILLDRLFAPAPRRYKYTEMQINIIEEEEDFPEEGVLDSLNKELKLFDEAYEDSLAGIGIEGKVHRLEEVTVRGKKRSRESDIFNNRSKSIAYYDIRSELDDVKDKGEFIGDDIHQLLINMNEYFFIRHQAGTEYMLYKNKLPLFVVNYQQTDHTELGYNKYKLVRLEAIKSIYISEDYSSMYKYADSRMSMEEVQDIYGCAVFIETYPEGEIPAEAGKGVRKTLLEGYSPVKEFYSPDYSMLPPEPDYRRTLYWNPSVVSDEKGIAKIRFYNNGGTRKFSINAETITPRGIIGVYKNE